MASMKSYSLTPLSRRKLESCNPRIQEVVEKALFYMDLGVLEGQRTVHRQRALFNEGLSKTMDSRHTDNPSNAIDLTVYVKGRGYMSEHTSPETYRQHYGMLAGILRVLCRQRGYNFRWGGDWDGDNSFEDQTFNDLGHFEIW